MWTQVVIVGVGFMCDAYDLFVINNVLNVMNSLYPQSTGDKSLVSSAALWGAVLGQLTFGFVSDLVGRRHSFVITLLLIIIGAIGSSLCVPTPIFSIYQQLAVWRFILGVGVGGEYPLAASIAAENSTPQARGRTVAAVFSMQGIGQLLATGLVNVLLEADVSSSIVWRVCLACGAVPGIGILYFRAKMEETREFTLARRTRVSHFRNLKAAFSVWWRQILGCALSWFLLDVSFYGNGLFSATISSLMGLGTTIQDAALASFYLSLMAIPGYYFTVAFLDTIGRWNLQVLGFLMLSLLFTALSYFFKPLQHVPALFILLYGLTFFFSNFGPNSTTYIIPGEYFPPQVKATCHAISAASGKIGAAVAGWVFPPALEVIGIQGTLYVCAAVGAAGVATTLLVPNYTADQLEDIKAAQLEAFETVLSEDPINGTTHPLLP